MSQTVAMMRPIGSSAGIWGGLLAVLAATSCASDRSWAPPARATQPTVATEQKAATQQTRAAHESRAEQQVRVTEQNATPPPQESRVPQKPMGATNGLEPSQQKLLLETDKAFARLALERGAAEAFYTYAAEDATVFPMGELPVQGREAIRIAMSTGPQGPLRWEPHGVELSRGADMGYTWGFYEMTVPGPDSRPILRYGKYLTIWKRQPDGSWRFIADMGNPAPPPRSETP